MELFSISGSLHVDLWTRSFLVYVQIERLHQLFHALNLMCTPETQLLGFYKQEHTPQIFYMPQGCNNTCQQTLGSPSAERLQLPPPGLSRPSRRSLWVPLLGIVMSSAGLRTV